MIVLGIKQHVHLDTLSYQPYPFLLCVPIEHRLLLPGSDPLARSSSGCRSLSLDSKRPESRIPFSYFAFSGLSTLLHKLRHNKSPIKCLLNGQIKAQSLDWFARATITECHRLGRLNNRNKRVLSHHLNTGSPRL